MSGLLYDLRDDPTPPERGYYGKKRDFSDVTGVMLHSTACRLGERPQRWKSVPVHAGVTMKGRVILIHDFLSILWHGNGPSGHLLGIEIDGNHLGYSTGEYWKGNPLDPLYAAQVASANEILLPLLQRWFYENGATWKYTVAHRQSSGDRIWDPGVEVWQLIALPWMRATGSTDGDLVWGKGALIPNDWDSRK